MKSYSAVPASAKSNSKKPAKYPASQTGVPHILIIEDEVDISTPLQIRLTKLGYQVTVADDGESGLAQALLLKPDLILLDLILPKLSGENVCKAIKESDHETIQKIPIIMMSAKDGEADQIIGRVIGANAYITKPFELDVLLEAMGKFVSCLKKIS